MADGLFGSIADGVSKRIRIGQKWANAELGKDAIPQPRACVEVTGIDPTGMIIVRSTFYGTESTILISESALIREYTLIKEEAV